METNGTNETLWSIVQYAAGAVLTGLTAVVAYVYRQLSRVEAVSNRVDVLADAVDDVVHRQNEMQHEQGDQRVMMAEVRNDVKWIRENLENHHK